LLAGESVGDVMGATYEHMLHHSQEKA
jgi:hypothetical protein